MTFLLVILHVMVCLILILVILLQVGRGHGLSGPSFGSSGPQSLFGVKTSHFLSRATTAAAIIFVLTTITLDILQAQRSRSLFQPGGRKGMEQPIDMEKMKVALEKIKQEAQRQAAKAEESTAQAKTKVSDTAAAVASQPTPAHKSADTSAAK